MDKDLIAGNFVINIDKRIIKQTLELFKIIFLLFFAYSILDLFDWYMIVTDKGPIRDTPLSFFSHTIRPLIALIILIGDLVIFQFYINANKLISASVEEENSDHFNKGYTFFYKAALLSIVLNGLSIISIITRLFLKYH